jgi:hypothetical protein
VNLIEERNKLINSRAREHEVKRKLKEKKTSGMSEEEEEERKRGEKTRK